MKALHTVLQKPPLGLVLGDLCIDLTRVVKLANRQNPEDPYATLYEVVSEDSQEGMSANYVRCLQHTFKSKVISRTTKSLLDHELILRERVYHLEGDNQLTYLSRFDTTPPQQPLETLGLLGCEQPTYAVFADYGKGSVTPDLVFKAKCVSSISKIYVDTKSKHLGRFKGCTVKLNSNEFEATKDSHHLPQRIIHTMGDAGAELIYPSDPSKNIRVPGSGAKAVNVSGAGDVFFATFIGAEQELGLREYDCLKMATCAAGISIRHPFTYTPTLGEVFREMDTLWTK